VGSRRTGAKCLINSSLVSKFAFVINLKTAQKIGLTRSAKGAGESERGDSMRIGGRQQAAGNRKQLKSLAYAVYAMLIAFCPPLEAQQTLGKIPRIGFIQRRVAPTANNPDPLGAAFRQGLRELGYIEGKNIQVEHRYGEGRSDRLPSIVSELLRLNVDIFVVASIQAIRETKKATTTIPIIIISQRDPVTDGLVHSLSNPGGNITGVTRLTEELSGKRLELLKETKPVISRVGILTGGNDARADMEPYENAARALNIRLHSVKLTGGESELERTFQIAAKEGVNAIVTNRDAVTASYAKNIAELAIRHRLPTMNEDGPYVEAGGLMSYAANDAEQFRRAAVYVDRILKGAKPADLPVEQPTKFELVINLRTAKQIGLVIPPNVLARADRVIR
jgi:putative tryptophan/tyrosine transport system substrate-binding protein